MPGAASHTAGMALTVFMAVQTRPQYPESPLGPGSVGSNDTRSEGSPSICKEYLIVP